MRRGWQLARSRANLFWWVRYHRSKLDGIRRLDLRCGVRSYTSRASGNSNKDSSTKRIRRLCAAPERLRKGMVMTKWFNAPARELLPIMCQKGITNEIEIIEDLVDEMNVAGEQAAICEATYKALYAQTRLTIRALAKTKLTVDEVEADATVQCRKHTWLT